MVNSINHFFSRLVSSPRDSWGIGCRSWQVTFFGGSCLGKELSSAPKVSKVPKVFTQSPFPVAFPESHPKHICPTKTPSMKHRKKETKNPCHTLIREDLIHFTEFIFRVSDEMFIRVPPLHVAVQSLHPGGQLLHYRHAQASLGPGVLHEVGQCPGHISHL